MGAGRITKDDDIDYGAGIRFMKKRGDAVLEGDTLCSLYVGRNSKLLNDKETVESIASRVRASYNISTARPLGIRSVIDVVGDK